MSARESIESLWDRATPVGPLLDQYAHELAEKIRAWADDPKVAPHLQEGEWTGLRMGANVIDPKKEGQ